MGITNLFSSSLNNYRLVFLSGCLLSIINTYTYAESANEADTYYAKGEQAYRSGLLQNAEIYLLRALDADSRHQPSYLKLGNLYYIQHRYQEGVDLLETGVDYYPNDAEMSVRYGMLLRSSGQFTRAKTAYDHAVDMAPDDPLIIERAAGYYKMTGNQTKAEELSQMRRKVIGEESK